MVTAIITFFIGLFFGVIIATLCVAASNRDDISKDGEWYNKCHIW